MPATVLPEGAWLAPGFIDCQVNGGGDILFNDEPTVDGIAAIAAAHRRFGTTSLLPTLITDTPDKMRAALEAAAKAAATNPGVAGIHIEGPFISPEKPGVHDPALIRPPTPGDLELLTAPRLGVTLVTLAPERVPAGFIAALVKAGVRVSLGHSMADYRQTKAALAGGLTGFTHLFNAMRPLSSRDPGPIAAALETPGAWFGMIVDGEHVDPAMLRLALRGAAHPMLVTDAMPPVGGAGAAFRLYGHEIAVRRGSLHEGGRHARGIGAGHGGGGAKLRGPAASAARGRAALRLGRARAVPGPRRFARPAGARLPRRHGRIRPGQHAHI